jgi:hypothetical protein
MDGGGAHLEEAARSRLFLIRAPAPRQTIASIGGSVASLAAPSTPSRERRPIPRRGAGSALRRTLGP